MTEKIERYRIGLCTSLDLEDGKHLCEPYYKVYSEYTCGSVWFEEEFSTLEEAKEYIRKETKNEN